MYVVHLVVKKMSARLSWFPNAAAHQANETPHPSHVPYPVLVIVVVISANEGDTTTRRKESSPVP